MFVAAMFARMKKWFEMFSRFIEIKRTEFFHSCILPCHTSKFSITDLVRTKFMLYRFPIFWYIVSMEISFTLKVTFHQTCVIFLINQIKGRLIKRQLKMLVMVQKKTVSNHLKQNLLFTLHY